MIRRPRLSGWLAVLALVPALAVAVPATASASHASAAVAATAPASLPATPAGTPFLWGAATSSYQVEGGINCLQPGPGNPWQNLGSPCDDYDFFFGNSNVHYRVNMLPSAADHPITRGLSDFDLVTEQYWVLSDDYIDVLATTTQAVREWDQKPGVSKL